MAETDNIAFNLEEGFQSAIALSELSSYDEYRYVIKNIQKSMLPKNDRREFIKELLRSKLNINC